MITLTPLDNGYYTISDSAARRLGKAAARGGPALPAPGRERVVRHDGKEWWLARTTVLDFSSGVTERQEVWSLREIVPPEEAWTRFCRARDRT